MLHRSYKTPGVISWMASLFLGLIASFSANSQEQASQEQASQEQAGKEPTQQAPAPGGKVVDFSRDVAPILLKRCMECHEGEKAKNGFVVSDREAVMGFVTAGSAAESSLWTDYLIAPAATLSEPSLRMPPDGPLPTGELAILKLWMDEGADWPEGATLADKPTPVAVNEVANGSPAWYRAIGYLHPAIVHFPIAFLIIAAGSVLLSYVLGDRYAQFAFNCLVLGFLFSIVTAVLGWSFAESRGYGDWTKMMSSNASEDEASIFLHRWIGSAVAIVGLVVVIAGWRNRQSDGTRPGHFWRMGVLVLAVLVGWVGHEGGELVYGDLIGKAISHFGK
jgi:uncharacterized membrane protein